MLELTEEQLKQIKWNKIKQIKSILIEFASIQLKNKIEVRHNQSSIDKLKYTCAKEVDIPMQDVPFDPTVAYAYDSAKIKVFKGLFNTKHQKLELKEYKSTAPLIPWLTKIDYWYSYYIDKTGKECRIGNVANDCTDDIINTLYFILYNKLKNKKRGHTHDDQKYIENHKEHWNLMLERMEVQQELLEFHHVKS
jgi:hypothetical protein